MFSPLKTDKHIVQDLSKAQYEHTHFQEVCGTWQIEPVTHKCNMPLCSGQDRESGDSNGGRQLSPSVLKYDPCWGRNHGSFGKMCTLSHHHVLSLVGAAQITFFSTPTMCFLSGPHGLLSSPWGLPNSVHVVTPMKTGS